MKVSNNIEKGITGKPHLERYASKLKALDINGDGEIDLEEICGAIDSMVQQEAQNRLLKRMTIIFGVLSLLTVLAVFGMTFAVVALSKDVSNNDDVLVGKSSGVPVSTAQYLESNSLAAVIQQPTPESLSQIKTIVVPGEGFEKYSVVTVVLATVNADDSVTFKLGTGEKVTYAVTSSGALSSSAIPGRRLLSLDDKCNAPNAATTCLPGCHCAVGIGPYSTTLRGSVGSKARVYGPSEGALVKVESPSPSPKPKRPPPPSVFDDKGMVTVQVQPAAVRPPPRPLLQKPPPPVDFTKQNVVVEVMNEGE